MYITLLQITTDNLHTSVSDLAAEPSEKLSLIELAFKGGIIMIPIAFLLLLTVFIFLKGIYHTQGSRGDKNFMLNIRDYISNGK